MPEEKKDDKGITVVVVDDDRAVRESLKFSLELEGFRVSAFPGGKELLNDPELVHAGCLVVDQVMPGMSGLEVIDAVDSADVQIPFC